MADSDYWGVFIRKYPHQIPNWSGSGGLWTQCPDIISGGTSELDPNQLLKDYKTPPTAPPAPAPFTLNQANYVYVTGENTAPQPMTVRVWIFWVAQSTCLQPSTWLSQGVKVGGKSVNYQALSAQAAPPWTDHTEKPIPGPPAVTTPPFVITPAVQTTSQDQFSLVTIVDNHPTDAAKPPLPDRFATVADLATWVSARSNVGWLNMTLVD
ncbi:hypothetical protein R69746_06520 [Paraburkholderia aspalathi]|uniref:hypothetical protein n=1 Tax=Paraburkholderia aspalathi TaxID=1324617 RepID=UPI00190E3C94|nr:hypothetical protein [Paraburkholderia aspalathi]MBK3842449.1 hypothetical protein [Paraburkholderia aspalathi]CAE6831439.1 hypothetical protein R69746_06520 [Paraburkholderia aspalathi]